MKQFLLGHTVREAMTQACFPLAPNVTIETMVEEYVSSGHRCFPIVSEGRILGLVNLGRIRNLPRAEWQNSVQAVMLPMDQVKSVSANDGLWEALERMTSEQIEQLPVMQDGQLIGMLMHDNILRFIQLRGGARD